MRDVASQASAARAIEIFRKEIDRMMTLIGCRIVAEVTSEYVKLP